MATDYFRYLLLGAAVSTIAACATVEPFPVPANNPPLASVRANINMHQNQAVVWGGQILSIEVKQTFALVSVLAKPLDRNGEPVQTDQSDGRFLARFEGFRDPAVFAVGRNLTVAGTIRGGETRKIGDYAYLYPVLAVKTYRLWPVVTSQSDDSRDYWWYDPWYPWYPWYYPHYYRPPSNLPPPKK